MLIVNDSRNRNIYSDLSTAYLEDLLIELHLESTLSQDKEERQMYTTQLKEKIRAEFRRLLKLALFVEKQPKTISECDEDCFNCKFPDCILSVSKIVKSDRERNKSRKRG